MMGWAPVGHTVSFSLFFLLLRPAEGSVVRLARFLPKAEVKVGEVAEMPMVVVVVALGGSMGTSASAHTQ